MSDLTHSLQTLLTDVDQVLRAKFVANPSSKRRVNRTSIFRTQRMISRSARHRDGREDKVTDEATDSSKVKRPTMLDASKPGSLKALRAKHQKDMTFSGAQHVMFELHRESDRSAAILAAAWLDDFLIFRICESRPFDIVHPDDVDWLFRPGGPMGSFSHRNEMACFFGVIDDETYQQLDIIREMRNICAHSRQSISFSDQAISNYVSRLFAPSITFGSLEWLKGNLRAAFDLEVMMIMGTLQQGSRAAALASTELMRGRSERSSER